MDCPTLPEQLPLFPELAGDAQILISPAAPLPDTGAPPGPGPVQMDWVDEAG